MVNNSALGKWGRLRAKQLDMQFRHEMIDGLQCSPFEASAILDAVYRVYGTYFSTSASLRPGQMQFSVISAEAGSQQRIRDSRQVSVTLTFDAGAEDLEMRRTQGVEGLRQHRLQRMSIEAFQQGGLLTVEDLANRIFNCGQRTLSRDLAVLHRKGVILPLRSTMKDMGRSVSHRVQIIEKWLAGREYSEIGRDTHHAVASVQNYVSKFKRAVALMQEGYDVHTIGFLVKLAPGLVEDYHALYQRAHVVPHRRKELESFLKKENAPFRRKKAA